MDDNYDEIMKEHVKLDREFEKTLREMDLDVIRACNTRIWINPTSYSPTEREQGFIVGGLLPTIIKKG
jgi:hypothetical protein